MDPKTPTDPPKLPSDPGEGEQLFTKVEQSRMQSQGLHAPPLDWKQQHATRTQTTTLSQKQQKRARLSNC